MLDGRDLDRIGAIVGAPIQLELLKTKPGRRATWRAHGSVSTAIVKAYATARACVVAGRLRALADGCSEPVVPHVLDVDERCHLLILSDVDGRPLREAVVGRDEHACRHAGAAVGGWHAAWQGVAAGPLRPHTSARELEILRERARTASPPVAAAVEELVPGLQADWLPTTVVHRDLYEEQVLLGDRVGLIDLDDAALGPPELDVANLVAHIELLGYRRAINVEAQLAALLDGYASGGPALDDGLLARCRALTLLRLACLNDDVALIELAVQAVAA